MFSHISRQHDLLGLPAFLFLKARPILQQLVIDELSWNEPLMTEKIEPGMSGLSRGA